MPANLPPEYFEAERHFKKASTTVEKIAALEVLIATVPKHKGTDKLRADLRRRLSKLKEESIDQKRKKGARFDLYKVEREGSSQAALVGLANSGKSSLLASLTNAEPVIANYPMSTMTPLPGMMPFEDIQIQLVDLPPLGNESTDGWVSSIIRLTDGIILLVDLIENPAGSAELLIETLKSWNIHVLKPGEKSSERGVSKRGIIVGTKFDVLGAEKGFNNLEDRLRDSYPVIPFSSKQTDKQDLLKKAIFNLMEIIRVYSKQPGKDPDFEKPFTLKRGSTVLDLCREIHKDFLSKLKYARVWGSARFDGQKVQKDYILKDKDVVEIHI
ncbi:MAG TPA: TGS domain-containing protein [Nitrospinota bacterium]|nr:TGS domain-containing protein [Nitrospinota bacterium]